MSTFDPDLKERIRQAHNLIDLARTYMELRPAGRVFKALCPWHPDSNPSLQFNPERQSYKCWVCGEGGDLFSFVMKIEGISFGEALKSLAERAGIEWRSALQTPGGYRPPPPGAPTKDDLFHAMGWAVKEYRRFYLEDPAAAEGRDYVQKRLINQEMQERFSIGFAPNEWSWLASRAAAAKIPFNVLETVGLLVPRQKGDGWIDRFRGRVLFPIRDVQGRPVGLGGRILPSLAAENPAKYINSPETPLFSKSSLLFGLDVARPAIQRARTAVVMEGYTDCIMAHQCGVQHVVAVLGTALTEKHLPLLKRFCDAVVLVLDGDDAGKRRANDLVKMFVAGRMDLRVVTLPDDLDPCDFLVQRGPEAFSHYLHHAPDALDYKIGLLTAGLDPRHDTFRATQALEELLSIMAAAPRLSETTSSQHLMRENQLLNRLAVQFGVQEELVRQRLRDLRQPRPRIAGPGGEPQSAPQMAPQPYAPPPLPPNRFVGSGQPGSYSRFPGKPGFQPGGGKKFGGPVGGPGANQGKPFGGGAGRPGEGRFSRPQGGYGSAPRDPAMYDTSAAPTPSAPAWEGELLELIVARPEFAADLEEHPEWGRLSDPDGQTILDHLLEIRRSGREATFDRLMSDFEDERLKRLLVDLDERCRQKGEATVEARWQALLTRLRQMAWDAVADHTERRMRQQQLDPAQQEEALLWLIQRRAQENKPQGG